MLSIIIFTIVILHLAAGFGYLMYKLSPSKKVIDAGRDKNQPVNKRKDL